MHRRDFLRTSALAATAVASHGLPGASQAHAAGNDPALVVELFTSQGCSSCPPADKLLGELSQNPNVIALTQAVDYWDYLGWKDENASHAHTERQRDYARLRGDRRVYTPQMVINGRVHVVGSRRGDVARSMEALSSGSGRLSVPISTKVGSSAVAISIAERPANFDGGKDGTLYLVPFKSSVTVDVKRGENRGRSITYHNVAEGLHPIGMWYGESVKVELPLNDIRKNGHDGCAVLLQADVGGLPGPIYGAAMISLR